MKILFYCQYVLGIGHLFRTLALCRALSPHRVILVTGGPPVDAVLPPNTEEVSMPGLMMDAQFKHLLPAGSDGDVESIKTRRTERLRDLFATERPDLFMVELYPFGRKAFRFELDPILAAIRRGDLPSCRVVCSLRDILVEKQDAAAYEERVVKTLNRYFDALVVHADPALISLSETFGRIRDIRIPLVYSGFVTEKPGPGAREAVRRELDIAPGRHLVVASAGGGKVGFDLLDAAVSAFSRISLDARLCVFTGPFMDAACVDRLKAHAGDTARISRFTPRFLDHLAAADLSISMAGYNTAMNILAAATPALLWPFAQNREQRMRAERLTRFGAIRVLEDRDLAPARLAKIMESALTKNRNPAPATETGRKVELDGARTTAAWLAEWMVPHE